MTPLPGAPVLVTGADGFIGSHLVERLVEAGAEVRALCLYNSEGAHGWLDQLDRERLAKMDLRLGDIRDAGLVEELVRGVDVVFHLAALVGIPYSYEAPASYLETNVRGTLNVLEAVRKTGVAKLVHTSTSEVYGTPHSVPIDESHHLRAQSPYAASKIAADKLCESYALSFGVRAVVLRPFNTFGPRQSTRAVIPTILTQLLAGIQEVRLGNLGPRRDFTYVTDTVEAFLLMAGAELDPGEVVHLGTGRAVSVAELFELCCDATGVQARPSIEADRARPDRSEVDVLLADPSRARELLGWSPTVALEEGLHRSIEWLRGRVRADRAARYHR